MAKTRFLLMLTFALWGLCSRGQAPSATPVDSVNQKLEQYKKLLDNGVIDQDEYNKMKAQLLSSQQQPAPAAAPAKAPGDSTQVKLDQLKKLYDTGVIGEDEYNRSRAIILGKPLPESKSVVKPDVVLTRADTMNLQALHDRYKSKVIAGSVILSVGVGFIVGDILYSTVGRQPNPKDSTYQDELTTHHGAQAALAVLGGVTGIGGAVFLALGLKDRAIYRRRNKTLSFNFTGNGVEFALQF